MRKPPRPHDDAGYRRRREQLMKTITPHTRCWRCKKLAHEHPLHRDGRPGQWQCGHTVPGNNRAPLALEWSSCNLSHGGRLGNERRWGRDGAPRPAPGPRKADNHYPGHFDLRNPKAVTAPPCVTVEGQLCATCAAYLAANPRHR